MTPLGFVMSLSVQQYITLPVGEIESYYYVVYLNYVEE
jgi:hypothetical protein